MSAFPYKNGQAYCEDTALMDIAEQVGTPCYVYSKGYLKDQVRALKDAFSSYPTQICYAVKANSNLSVLREIFSEGVGADLVSLGELERALKAGAKPEEIVFSGVGKREDEIRRALSVGILSFNVESREELRLIARVAKELNKRAPVSLRINPNIDAKTNPKITTGLFSTKFGLVEDEAIVLASELLDHPNLELKGVGCHIGSQILDIRPLQEAAFRVAAFAKALMDNGHKLSFIDLGGGLGIQYDEEKVPDVKDYAKAMIDTVRPLGLKLIIEPGRHIAGNMGVLLCKVLATKTTPKKNFLIVDGAMNDLIRPSMYDAYHAIRPVLEPFQATEVYDVVGPVCETGDIFGEDRTLPPTMAGDYVYLASAGAYGFTMASNYNTRGRPAEVLVDGQTFRVIRRRETLEDLWALEENPGPELRG